MSTPKEVWDELIRQGASSVQAAAAMGNAFYESGFNPESNAMDSNGKRSYGIFQENGKAGNASLVTGNPAVDLRNQVTFMIQHGGLRAATGTNAADAAGNFAQHYEVCTECKPGGAQWVKRRAKAATLFQEAMTGQWPSSGGGSAGNPATGGTGGSNTLISSTPTNAPDTCAWNFALPSVSSPNNLGPIPLPNVTIGGQSFCVLSKVAVRELLSVLIMGTAVAVGMLGAVVLVAYGLKATGIESAVGRAASVIPGGKAVSRASKRSANKGRQPKPAAYSGSEFTEPTK